MLAPLRPILLNSTARRIGPKWSFRGYPRRTATRLRVCVARNPSDEYGIRIHGSAWVDDVSLVPDPAAGRKP